MSEKIKMHFVSHTHWDREWYMTFQQYRRRLVKMVDHLIEIFDNNQGFKCFIMDGQVVPIKDYLEIRPEKEGKIKQLVSAGRLLIGPWYTQPNEFMVSGEALIRNLILGYKESEALGGVMKICYLPDAFGHISQLPQLIKGFGMDVLISRRGMPRGSKSEFTWTGADGTECLAVYMLGNYAAAYDLTINRNNYIEYVDSTPMERMGLDRILERILKAFENRSVTPVYLIMNGNDHSFANNNTPEIIDEINAVRPDIKAIHSNFTEYLEDIKAFWVKRGITLEKASGELRDPSEELILPASQSTRMDIKIYSNKLEGLFEKWMEPFSSFAWLIGYQYPSSEIWRAWEYLLQNHAHDSMACSSNDASYRQIITRFEWADEIGQEITDESLQAICNNIVYEEDKASCNQKIISVFNPLSWERDETITAIVDIPCALGYKHIRLYDGNREVPVQIHSVKRMETFKYHPRMGYSGNYFVDRYELTFQPGGVPGNGYKALVLRGADTPVYLQDSLIKKSGIMENEYLRLELKANGTFDLLHKETGKLYEGLHYFEDCGEAGHGFAHMRPEKDKIISSQGMQASIELIEDGPFKAAFRVSIIMNLPEGITHDRRARSERYTACDISSIITMFKGSPRIDIDTTINNRSKDHRLRLIIPTGLDAAYSYAEQPFDIVRRNVKLPDFNDYPREKPSPTHPQLGFVDVTDGTCGIMAANEGLYEYEVVDNEERSIAITLLRCTDRLYDDFLGRCEKTLITGAQCIGIYSFRYSIIPHSGSYENAFKHAYEYKYPMKAVIERALEEEALTNYVPKSMIRLPLIHSFVEVSNEKIIISAIKKCETRDSLIIRFWNILGHETKALVKVNIPGSVLNEAYIVNMNESRECMLPVTMDGQIELAAHQKGIYTIEFVINGGDFNETF